MRIPCVLLLSALAVGACKKKPPPPPPPDDPVPVQDVETRLQITSMSPGSVEANTATTGKIYGSAFESGATVSFGDRSAAGATVVDPNTIDVEIPALNGGRYDVTVSNPDGSRTTLRDGLNVRLSASASDCRRATVYFDFDSAGLTSNGRSVLDKNAACYQQGANTIRIEGHADARGTTDYNLALGERRAKTVERHLSTQGVGRGRLKTVSYGEERPAQSGSNESSWSKNRRAEVNAE